MSTPSYSLQRSSQADRSDLDRDQVEWGAAEEEFAAQALEKQRNSPVPQHLQDEFNANPAGQWDKFYAVNKGASMLPSRCRSSLELTVFEPNRQFLQGARLALYRVS